MIAAFLSGVAMLSGDGALGGGVAGIFGASPGAVAAISGASLGGASLGGASLGGVAGPLWRCTTACVVPVAVAVAGAALGVLAGVVLLGVAILCLRSSRLGVEGAVLAGERCAGGARAKASNAHSVSTLVACVVCSTVLLALVARGVFARFYLSKRVLVFGVCHCIASVLLCEFMFRGSTAIVCVLAPYPDWRFPFH